MRTRLRTWFIAGLLVFLPVVITVSIILWLFRIVDGLLGRLLPLLIGRAIPGVGLVTSLVLIVLIGALATNVLGRRVVGLFERLLLRVPLARSIYSATKAVSDVLFLQRRAAFQRPVLVQWPRQGMYTVGFVTGATDGLPDGGRAINVFVVTTPNPTTGFLMLVPERDAVPLEMSVEDALKIVMSGGLVSATLHPARGEAGRSATAEEGA